MLNATTSKSLPASSDSGLRLRVRRVEGLVAEERASVIDRHQDHRPLAEELAQRQLAARVVAESAVQRQPRAQLLVEADLADHARPACPGAWPRADAARTRMRDGAEEDDSHGFPPCFESGRGWSAFFGSPAGPPPARPPRACRPAGWTCSAAHRRGRRRRDLGQPLLGQDVDRPIDRDAGDPGLLVDPAVRRRCGPAPRASSAPGRPAGSPGAAASGTG